MICAEHHSGRTRRPVVQLLFLRMYRPAPKIHPVVAWPEENSQTSGRQPSTDRVQHHFGVRAHEPGEANRTPPQRSADTSHSGFAVLRLPAEDADTAAPSGLPDHVRVLHRPTEEAAQSTSCQNV